MESFLEKLVGDLAPSYPPKGFHLRNPELFLIFDFIRVAKISNHENRFSGNGRSIHVEFQVLPLIIGIFPVETQEFFLVVFDEFSFFFRTIPFKGVHPSIDVDLVTKPTNQAVRCAEKLI